MNQTVIRQIKTLTQKLNLYRDMYYNQSISLVSDKEYDDMFDELAALEKSTGIVFSNSPTQTVGYECKSLLDKVHHSHPMLSLDKTKSIDDLQNFAADKDCMLSLKMDGLTILLTYDNGVLIQAETRGNGAIGEIVTHNAKVFNNIPLNIDCKGRIEIEGEAIITYTNFNNINQLLPNDKQYKNPRNLVSGSVRQLNNEIAAKRYIDFIAWKIPHPYSSGELLDDLKFLVDLGFDVVPCVRCNCLDNKSILTDAIQSLQNIAVEKDYPIDGLVMTYNNINFGMSLGMTGHHPKHSLAFKFYDDEYETKLLSIDWTLGKTGQITPTAVFEPVEIDGTIVERASLHNVSIFKSFDLCLNDIVTVYKANQIIPQLKENISQHNTDTNTERERYKFAVSNSCPVCGQPASIHKENKSEFLYCDNPSCKGKLLGNLTHFVSRDAMNIEGLSKSTLEKFICKGWLSSFIDLYSLHTHYNEIVIMEGFGKKSTDKLLLSIESSKTTTLDKFIYALSIPLIGKTAAKTISQYFKGDINEFIEALNPNTYFDWKILNDFGLTMQESITLFGYIYYDWMKEQKLADILTFTKIKEPSNSNLSGLIFVITGSLETFTNRDEAKTKIEALGGKVSGSVSAKTNYLINNDIDSNSSKNKKAKELGIPIITETELLKMLGI